MKLNSSMEGALFSIKFGSLCFGYLRRLRVLGIATTLLTILRQQIILIHSHMVLHCK